ncbi:MAG: cupin domain-containing protein [Planctomycetes bacterium]|nr:cupin domain-containing protein [Planctomycetota bacterium]
MRRPALASSAGDMPSPEAAEVVLSCREIAACVDFFVDHGFRLESIFPADEPRRARLTGHGLRLALERGDRDGGGHLRIRAERAREVTAPNGARLEFAPPPRPGPTWQRATFFVRRGEAEDGWHEGRAGMLYRDLVGGRQDGSLIASRIRIPRGGPVRDYVHFHRVAAQVIYCRKGSVRVVYEDQGEPFLMRAGDCVLQPPEIRHRVLESSDELEVVEVSSPAEHETCVDHELELPNDRIDPAREFSGQRFVRHQGSGAVLQPWDIAGFDARETGIAKASGGAVGVRVVRPAEPDAAGELSHRDDRRFWFVLRGALTLRRGGEAHRLTTDAACVLPPGEALTVTECTADLELLEVAHNRQDSRRSV